MAVNNSIFTDNKHLFLQNNFLVFHFFNFYFFLFLSKKENKKMRKIFLIFFLISLINAADYKWKPEIKSCDQIWPEQAAKCTDEYFVSVIVQRSFKVKFEFGFGLFR